jgi:hypothetical protein
MPRKLKPYPVSEVTDRETGHTFQIMLDREDKTFFANVLGLRIEAGTAKECERLTLEKIKDETKMEWRKILRVRTGGNYTKGMEMEYSVHEIAKRTSTRERCWAYVERTLVPSFHDRPEAYAYQDFPGDVKSHPESGEFILPWSEAVEAGLMDIRIRIKETQAKLKQILEREDAAEKLAKSGWSLLTMRGVKE